MPLTDTPHGFPCFSYVSTFTVLVVTWDKWKHGSACGNQANKMWYYMQHVKNMLPLVITCGAHVFHTTFYMLHINPCKFHMGPNIGLTHYKAKMFQNHMMPMHFSCFTFFTCAQPQRTTRPVWRQWFTDAWPGLRHLGTRRCDKREQERCEHEEERGWSDITSTNSLM